MTDEIDAVDFAIMKCLAQTGGCWKKQVHNWIKQNQEKLPTMESRSIQTIGRRIDQLHDAGKIESCILSPDSVNRDMIIGFKLTDEGRETISAKRNEFLKDKVIRASKLLLRGEPAEVSVKRPALIELMMDEFDISPSMRENVLEESSTRELIGVLTGYYFRIGGSRGLDEAAEDRMITLIEETPKLRQAFGNETISDRIRARLAQAQNTVEGEVWQRLSA